LGQHRPRCDPHLPRHHGDLVSDHALHEVARAQVGALLASLLLEHVGQFPDAFGGMQLSHIFKARPHTTPIGTPAVRRTPEPDITSGTPLRLRGTAQTHPDLCVFEQQHRRAGDGGVCGLGEHVQPHRRQIQQLAPAAELPGDPAIPA